MHIVEVGCGGSSGVSNMFDMSIGVSEHIFRAVVVYVFLFLLLRFVGKKHVGELAPFDLLVLLTLSETVQNAMIGEDKSLIGGLISAGTLIALVQVMGYLSWRSKKIQRLLEGKPTVLVRHGRRHKEMMRERVSISELTEALRRQYAGQAPIRVSSIMARSFRA
jgi:uncharacterized membrane protein YcaP (DUF421 family)